MLWNLWRQSSSAKKVKTADVVEGTQATAMDALIRNGDLCPRCFYEQDRRNFNGRRDEMQHTCRMCGHGWSYARA
jgi:hypothetical protein